MSASSDHADCKRIVIIAGAAVALLLAFLLFLFGLGTIWSLIVGLLFFVAVIVFGPDLFCGDNPRFDVGSMADTARARAAASVATGPAVAPTPEPEPEPEPEDEPTPEPATPVVAPQPDLDAEPEPVEVAPSAPQPVEDHETAKPAERAPSTIAPSAPQPVEDAGAAAQPEALSEAREGGPDDLKKIKGVGPKLEQVLHSLGIYHFDQIAAWGPAEVAWMDDNLAGFKGRVTRDGWVDQAGLLAAGEDTEFSKKVDDGDIY